jgi:GNAT superfamily N-acetyltransferase
MTVEIREVQNHRQLRDFIRFPLSLYKNNRYYVPSLYMDEMNTLRSDKNPAFAEAQARYFLAYRDGKIVGRVAGILVPKHELKWGDKYMRFGWLDFIDDPEVSTALISEVEKWAQELGMNGLHGPLGFTDLDREGMLIDGFDEVATLATLYNYPYYQTHIEALGYTKDVDWLEYEIIMSGEHMGQIRRTADLVAKKYNLHLLKGNKRTLLKYAPQLFDVLDEAYRNLYGTVPLSKAQVQGYINSYFGFAIPEFIPIILDANDKVVAFGITFPSFSEALQKSKGDLLPFGFIHFLKAMKKNKIADLYLIGVRDEYRGKGLNSMMMVQIYDAFTKHGISIVEGNPNLEDNIAVQTMWKFFENRVRKRRRCFVKHLTASKQE